MSQAPATGDGAERIDAVIAWVDGSDPAHRQRLEAYLTSVGQARPRTAHPTRFNDAGEITHCVASILRFAPWIGTIHIVTDQQVPQVYRALQGTPDGGRVRIVDHREIFQGFEAHLPTFSARAISSMLWRIPGLSERFVYFNDDFALLRAVEPRDFFHRDHVVLRGRWRLQRQRGWLGWLRRPGAAGAAQADLAKSHGAQELAARMAGYARRYFYLYHSPYAMRRSTLERYFAAHPRALEENVRDRLRSSRQFRTECLAAHLELAAGSATVDDRLRTVQLKPREQAPWRVRSRMRKSDRDETFAFACVQSLELAPASLQGEITGWLDRRVGRVGEASGE